MISNVYIELLQRWNGVTWVTILFLTGDYHTIGVTWDCMGLGGSTQATGSLMFSKIGDKHP